MHGDGHEQIYHLHEKYGPLIRIQPNEVAINDIEHYLESIYTQNTKFTKAPSYYNAFDFPRSNVFSETSREVHSQEKRLMSHAFSRKNVVGMQDTFYDSVERWVAQIKASISKGNPIPLWHDTQCLKLETASRFSYGSSDGALKTDNFAHPIFLGIEGFAPSVVVFQHFPIVRHIAMLAQRLMPSGLPDINKGAAEGLVRLRERKLSGETAGMIIFDSMMGKAQSKGINLDPDRLVSNGGLMLIAGEVLLNAMHHVNEGEANKKRIE
ncbi:uncharacterized protein A1O9_10271 [Exophiala aquamarina CBS 119918]|uniref:Cytochrome P450 oxidoreductase n=1 Tax=Exophiala aquamarina CBS 119918 TaxID=1182545 RepID=A0A072P178_9EURO|nr:uncharacterized protein A1O9_10271 [Exophiala aquamarina CBS 119918]KEF53869.1 hypothetical protein A1O9_10271 [Exophiala aquamarina CBS 119918]